MSNEITIKVEKLEEVLLAVKGLTEALNKVQLTRPAPADTSSRSRKKTTTKAEEPTPTPVQDVAPTGVVEQIQTPMGNTVAAPTVQSNANTSQPQSPVAPPQPVTPAPAQTVATPQVVNSPTQAPPVAPPPMPVATNANQETFNKIALSFRELTKSPSGPSILAWFKTTYGFDALQDLKPEHYQNVISNLQHYNVWVG